MQPLDALTANMYKTLGGLNLWSVRGRLLPFLFKPSALVARAMDAYLQQFAPHTVVGVQA